MRCHLKDLLICDKNSNEESDLDLLNLPLWGQPTYTALAIDSSHFKNPVKILDEQHILHGNEPQQDSNDDDELDKDDDIQFKISDIDNLTNFNLLHDKQGRDERPCHNKPSNKFL